MVRPGTSTSMGHALRATVTYNKWNTTPGRLTHTWVMEIKIKTLQQDIHSIDIT